MAIQWTELLTAKTPREQFNEFLEALRARDWPVNTWQPGDVGRTLVEISSEVLADLSKAAVNIAKGGFLDTADGQWLDWIAEQFYSTTRTPATFCERTMKVTVAAGAPFLTKGVGELLVSDSTGKFRFRNKGAIAIAAGTAGVVTFRAEAPGNAHNAVLPTLLNIAIPGVSLSLPLLGSAVVVYGNDRESDLSLRRRCRNLFPSQGTGATQAAYESWALAASDEVRRVQALPPTGDGVVHLRLASESGTVSSAAETAVRNYITERQPLTASLDVLAATPVPVDVTATIYAPEQYLTNAKAEAQTNLAELLKTLPIGNGGTVYRSALIEQLMLPIGVVNAVMSSPSADVTIVDGQVAKLGTVTITPLPVE